jgi:tripartite-type tricarboxylate transporter receptor subunit TctC
MLADFLPSYDASNWWGICAPKGTPVEIVDKLNRAVNSSFDDPKIKERLAELGATPLRGSSAEFGKLIAEEAEKWAKVISSAGIKPG